MSRNILMFLICFLLIGSYSNAQQKFTEIVGIVKARGMSIGQDGRFNPTLTLSNCPIQFNFTQEEASKYGLIKDGKLIDITNREVDIIYEDILTKGNHNIKIHSFKFIR